MVYTVNVASTVDSVRVTAQPQDSGATVSINGQPTTSRSVSLGAAGSSTDILIDVTAPNGNQKTYAVTVNRAAIVLSGNNNLSGLVVSAGPLDPPFDAGTTNYNVQAPLLTADTTVTATVADSTATLTINGHRRLLEWRQRVFLWHQEGIRFPSSSPQKTEHRNLILLLSREHCLDPKCIGDDVIA